MTAAEVLVSPKFISTDFNYDDWYDVGGGAGGGVGDTITSARSYYYYTV